MGSTPAIRTKAKKPNPSFESKAGSAFFMPILLTIFNFPI